MFPFFLKCCGHKTQIIKIFPQHNNLYDFSNKQLQNTAGKGVILLNCKGHGGIMNK